MVQEPIEVTVARIDEHCKLISASLARMDTRLFGNGQPGVIDKLSNRADSLESTRDRVKGALYVISGAISVLGGTIVAHLFGKL